MGINVYFGRAGCAPMKPSNRRVLICGVPTLVCLVCCNYTPRLGIRGFEMVSILVYTLHILIKGFHLGLP
ncbi:hypothetical protein F5X97DRAFT_279379 [Nemania serpens]|nr:hypothetical protein F5X97DRAFT_279379 [Nemania serpens]